VGSDGGASPAAPTSAVPPPNPILGDLVAGVSVAFVCIPQSLAYAGLAQLSPTQGLHSNAIAPFGAAPLASSKYLQSGAVALSSLLTGAALTGINLVPGTPDFAAAASVLAAVVGCVRVAMGLLRGGTLIQLLPQTVLDGFVLGACWLVLATQVPVILGAAPPPGMHFISGAFWLLARPWLWQPGCIVTAAATVGCLLGGKRIHPLFPGAVVATLLGCAASVVGLPVGNTVGAVSAGLPSPVNPASLPWHLLPQLAVAGAAIAVAGIAEAVAIGSRFAKEAGQEWDCNRELISQGACNLLVAAFGGFPVAGSLSRTSLGRTAGATTQRAHFFTGIAVCIFLPLGAALLSALPKAVLGGLVATAVMPLLKPSPSLLLNLTARQRKRLALWPIRDLFLGWTTCAVTLGASPHLEVGLETGLVLAVALAALQVLDNAYMESLRDAAAHPDTTVYLEPM
jgi:SulP family sulfate permease